jgi:uncharacterized protein YdeI (YjbR/CyaY-like superfamily)
LDVCPESYGGKCPVKISKTLYVTNRDDWRAWLKKHHETEKEIWLIYYKKHTNHPRIPYDDAVEEALCFGWIDSIVQKIDDERYAQKFTPRKSSSKWSESNKRRVRKLLKEGKMTQAGLAKIGEGVLEAGEGSKSARKRKELVIPPYLGMALRANKKAWENFSNLAPSYRRQYVGWIATAKKEETRKRRIREAIELLARNEKLGMR